MITSEEYKSTYSYKYTLIQMNTSVPLRIMFFQTYTNIQEKLTYV